MRSRYSAYALGLVDYVLATTHPDGPHHGRYGQREEVAAFCANTDFQGLQVLEAREEGAHGEVRFRARLAQGGRDASFGEHSVFFKVSGRWLYHSGERLREPGG